MRCLHLGIAREAVTDRHWILYPDDDVVFHRVFAQSNMGPHNQPAGHFALTVEVTYGAARPLPCDGDALRTRVLDDLRRAGLLRADDRVTVVAEMDIPCAGVVPDQGRAEHVQLVREWMGRHGIVLAGRHGEWTPLDADQAMVAGRRAAEQVCEAKRLLERALA